jgi:hypothetical protein
MRRLVLLVVFATPLLVRVQADSRQPASAQDRLDAVVQKIIARAPRGRPPPDPEALLRELRAIDPAGLSPASAIDRRFAQTILAGRQLTAEHRDGPMGEAAYTRMLREQYLLPYDAAGPSPDSRRRSQLD